MTAPRPTETERDQIYTENALRAFLEDPEVFPLLKEKHTAFVTRNIQFLPEGTQGLHCSRPWLVYWTLHAADLLGVLSRLYGQVPQASIAQFLMMCWSEDDGVGDRESLEEGVAVPQYRCGGFGGGPGQVPHLATSYAAVSALAILSSPAAFDKIPREAIENWLVTLRSTFDGSFRMHTGGETDVRATYCAAVISTILALDMKHVFPPAAVEYVAACQTHEGGIGCDAIGGTEAHGGYTQCGVAAMLLLQQQGEAQIDVTALRRWCSRRQMADAGGFNGRTNKLVDSCYSFWVGSSAVMTEMLAAQKKMVSGKRLTIRDIALLDYAQLIDLSMMQVDTAELQAQQPWTAADIVAETASEEGWSDTTALPRDEVREDMGGDHLFNQLALQHYVLQCCQNSEKGGLMDKPNYPNDQYHTCYSLSGCSIALNNMMEPHAQHEALAACAGRGWLPKRDPRDGWRVCCSPADVNFTRLNVINPIFNICKHRLVAALKHFSGKSFL